MCRPGRRIRPCAPSGPGHVHQTDFVGPCFLRGPVRFYNLHSVDVATGRCGVQQLRQPQQPTTLDALWAIWLRLGIPDYQQIDNEMVFYGSRAHPRGLGPLIRLCLAMQVEPWFIPPAEPWRNGIVEKFNDRWQQYGPLRQDLRSGDRGRRANGTLRGSAQRALPIQQAWWAHAERRAGREPRCRLRFPDQPTRAAAPLAQARARAVSPHPLRSERRPNRFVRRTAPRAPRGGVQLRPRHRRRGTANA